MLDLNNGDSVLEFTVNGGDEIYSIPWPKDLPYSMFRKTVDIANEEDISKRNNDSIDFIIDVIDHYNPGLGKELTINQIQTIIAAWNTQGVGLGE